jgi:hypothetical protein
MNRYLCPVCRSTISKLPSAGLSFKTHFQIFLITGILAGIVYLTLGPWSAAKSLLTYLPLWTAAEWVHWLRIREAARCRTCDFDPLLYRRDWKAARRRVEMRMQGLSEELQQRIQSEIKRLNAQRTKPSSTSSTSSTSTSNAPAKSP